MLILDTDHLTLLERGGGDALVLQMRLGQASDRGIATTIITRDEQMRGWLSRAAQADTAEKLVVAHSRLQTHIETFRDALILPFDNTAAVHFESLRRQHVRVGTMDFRIAAMASDATLLTRNLRDFSKVPGLRAEDWSV